MCCWLLVAALVASGSVVGGAGPLYAAETGDCHCGPRQAPAFCDHLPGTFTLANRVRFDLFAAAMRTRWDLGVSHGGLEDIQVNQANSMLFLGKVGVTAKGPLGAVGPQCTPLPALTPPGA